MKDLRPQLRRLFAERRASAILGVMIIAMLWGGIFIKYFQDVQLDRREAVRTSENFARIFEENVLRSIGEMDKSLLYLRRSIEHRRATESFHAIVSTEDILSEIIVQVAIIDADGIMRASNAGPQPAPPTDLSDREHYRVHRDSKLDRLFISKPLVGRVSNRWSVQFTRPFFNADHGFAGVVVASLDPAHLTNFYNTIDFGASASIALIGDDGVVRSSGGSTGGFDLGQDLKSTKLFESIGAEKMSTFDYVDPATNEGRMVTFRRVKGQPLLVSVVTDQADVVRSSWYALQLNSCVALVFTLVVLAAIKRILKSEAGARQKARQLQLTLENMTQGIMLVTNDLQIPIINSRCGELLNLPPEFVQSPPRFDELVNYQRQHLRLRQSEGQESPAEENGSARVTVSECAVPNGNIVEVRTGHMADGSFVQTFTDITSRRRAEERVARLAAEDPLTGLPNRRLFRSKLEEICGLARNNEQNNRSFAVLFLDLDRFKVINDTLGHRVGDLLLQQVATRLQRLVGGSTMLARLGGDEFAIIVPELPSRSYVETLAATIVNQIVEPYEIDGYHIRSSISVGIAVGPEDGQDADELLVAADLALYAVKAQGRGSFRFYHLSMNSELQDRRQIEMGLRQAIERKELELHYQPIIDLTKNSVVGFEALARWRHRERGLVPPTVFIPVAEETGLVIPFGEWALREACLTAARWPSDLWVSVNLSPAQLLSPNLVDMVRHCLAEAGLEPNRLEIEITERIFMDDTEPTLTNLKSLKELGCRIALDDFGTGFSSLSYLRRFPFDKIKIDRSFVSDLDGGTEHVVIVQAVVSIARALGMSTTAEGIEVAQQQEFLSALGCDEGQGFHFSAAVPTDEVPKIIHEWRSGRSMAA